ncbi:MAG: hypothetical protein EOP06_06510 [Proteobacteria bacterium]|nr:MAG: hypothetical protein EOP06_06510 [Pseudomonadota bacterium]
MDFHKGDRSKPAFQAFTLIELLVLIVSVSMLAAILFPVLSRGRENSLQSHCTSNLRQLGLGWMQYARDYDQKTMRFSTSKSGKTVYWWGSFDGTKLRPSEGLLGPYLKSVNVLACPAFKNNSRPVIGSTGYAYNNTYLSPVSYGPAPDYTETHKVVALTQIKSPTETVVMADSARINIGNGDPVLESNTYLSTPRTAYPTLHARHSSLANVLWADGHVNTAKPIFRTGGFGYSEDGPYYGKEFQLQNLGDLDHDGDLETNECFDLD